MRYVRFFLLAGVILAAALFSVGCRTETPTEAPLEPTNTAVPPTEVPTEEPTATPTELPEESPTPTVTPTPLVSGPTDFPENVNPLTGMVVDDVSLLERNPVMVKVSNFPRGLRPHTGLTWADIVFEYFIGAGATRYSAIFYGQNAPEVGPVRSARLIDAQLGNLYNTVFAFASADARVYNRVLNALGDRAITESPSTCPAICRTGNGDVNSVFAVPEEVTKYADETVGITPVRPLLDGTYFNPTAPEGGEAGSKVTVKYSLSTISEWQFDAESNLYLRFIEEVDANGVVTIIPLVDAVTDEQLTAANVIVLFVETIEITPTLHDFNLANNLAGQRALLFRDGQVYELLWKSQGPQLPVQFFDLNGELVPLKPGNTWFHVVGISSSQEETAPGEWEVFNFLP